MLTNIIFIAKKDFSYSLKEKTLLIWMFIMPLVFFGFIGSTTGGFGGNSNKKANLAIWLPVARLNQSNALVMQIIHRLEKENFNTVIFDAESDKKELKYHFQDYTRKLWIPEKIQHKFEKGEQIEIQYLSTASGLSQSRDKFAIEKALYQTLGDILIFKKTHKQLTQLDFTEINKQTKKITASVSNAGEKLDIPNGFNQAVPGILVMFIMMIALTNGSLSIFLERKSGILKRLAASPLSTKEIIMGKWLVLQTISRV